MTRKKSKISNCLKKYYKKTMEELHYPADYISLIDECDSEAACQRVLENARINSVISELKG